MPHAVDVTQEKKSDDGLVKKKLSEKAVSIVEILNHINARDSRRDLMGLAKDHMSMVFKSDAQARVNEFMITQERDKGEIEYKKSQLNTAYKLDLTGKIIIGSLALIYICFFCTAWLLEKYIPAVVLTAFGGFLIKVFNCLIKRA